jgi:hypothetical protein
VNVNTSAVRRRACRIVCLEQPDELDLPHRRDGVGVGVAIDVGAVVVVRDVLVRQVVD